MHHQVERYHHTAAGGGISGAENDPLAQKANHEAQTGEEVLRSAGLKLNSEGEAMPITAETAGEILASLKRILAEINTIMKGWGWYYDYNVACTIQDRILLAPSSLQAHLSALQVQRRNQASVGGSLVGYNSEEGEREIWKYKLPETESDAASLLKALQEVVDLSIRYNLALTNPPGEDAYEFSEHPFKAWIRRQFQLYS